MYHALITLYEPKPQSIIGSRWIYKVKYNVGGSINKHKSRLIARGFTQKPGIDYVETFLVAKIGTSRALFAIAIKFGWEIHQMDKKNNFLNCDLKEEFYMFQPKEFEETGKENYVCKLRNPCMV